MKRIVTIALCAVTLTAMGQTEYPDTTISMGVNDVFYSFQGGVLKTEPADNWDIAFEINGISGSIIINDGAGVALYKTPFTSGEWSTFDTTGMSAWPQQFNSAEFWEEGAFNQGRTDDFDLGWGKYDVSSHLVQGDSVFLIKLRNGAWKKIMILNLATGKYNFKYADVDGGNEMTKAVAKSSFSGKLFGYYSIVDNAQLDREPNGQVWDLVFTKYLMPINIGTIVYYPVYGVKSNKGVEVARRTNTDVTNNDTVNLLWEYNITNIGSDWKTFDNQNQTYTMTPDLSFFVKTTLDEVWKMYFTEYVGGTEGMSVFNVTMLRSSTSVRNTLAGQVTIYPNPANTYMFLTSERNLTDVTISVKDIQGRVIQSEKMPNMISARIDVASIPEGIYLFEVEAREGTIVERIIIQ